MVVCPIALRLGDVVAAVETFTANNDTVPNLGADGSGADPATFLDALAGNDTVNTGIGRDLVTGGAGDDIISDHGGHDILKGGPGNDILISRSGGDALYGGGAYNTYTCTDVAGMDADMMTCMAYTADVSLCETANTDTFVSIENCCACGGGTPGAAVPVTAEDMVALMFSNIYVIYPTHEKEHHFDWTPVNLNVGVMNFTCTKICGMTLMDEIEFRLDDPNYEDYKYTDLDDTCALSVDGWEINWYLGD